MNDKAPAMRIVRRALALGALAGGLLAASLALGAVPAFAAYTAKVKNGTLELTGNGASDKLALRLNGAAPNILEVDVGEDGTTDFSFDRTTFTAIDVAAGAGDDEIRIDRSGGTFTDENVTMDGGPGDDHFQWDPGDGSDVVEGQGGDDTLDFNGSNASEQITLAANGNRTLLTRDIANVNTDFDGIEHVNLRTLGGTDTTTVNDLAATSVNTVDVNLNGTDGNGDGAPDTVVVNGTESRDNVDVTRSGDDVLVNGLAADLRISGSERANDTLQIQTLGGDDDVTIDPTRSCSSRPS
jgi:hypothetical protein